MAHQRHLRPVWDGRPLAGRRVLVRCYHGLGDTVQFIRFAPRLQHIASEVILWTQPLLIPLLRTARGIDRLIALHDEEPHVDWDVDIELMELPHALRILPSARATGLTAPRGSAPNARMAQRQMPLAMLGGGRASASSGDPVTGIRVARFPWRSRSGERTPWYPSLTLYRQQPGQG